MHDIDAGDAARLRPCRVSAVRLSIAAAMVIAKPVYRKFFTIFCLADLRREMSTKSNNNAVAAGACAAALGAGRWHRISVLAAGADGARLFQSLRAAEAAADRRRRGHAAVRAGAATPPGAVPAAQIREITPEFLDRTIRALKRWKFDIVSIDEVCRRAVTLPVSRRFVCLTFDGGHKDVIDAGLSGIVQARCSLHGLPADRVSGRARRGVVAGAGGDDRARKPHQPCDRPQGASLHDAQQRRRNFELYEFLVELDAYAEAAGSFICDQRSLQALFGRPRGVDAPRIDGLGRSGQARGRSECDDRKCDGELSGAVEPEGCRRAARDRDGEGGRGGRLSPRRQAFRLSVWRPRCLPPATCGDGARRRVSSARHPR